MWTRSLFTSLQDSKPWVRRYSLRPLCLIAHHPDTLILSVNTQFVYKSSSQPLRNLILWFSGYNELSSIVYCLKGQHGTYSRYLYYCSHKRTLFTHIWTDSCSNTAADKSTHGTHSLLNSLGWDKSPHGTHSILLFEFGLPRTTLLHTPFDSDHLFWWPRHDQLRLPRGHGRQWPSSRRLLSLVDRTVMLYTYEHWMPLDYPAEYSLYVIILCHILTNWISTGHTPTNAPPVW